MVKMILSRVFGTAIGMAIGMATDAASAVSFGARLALSVTASNMGNVLATASPFASIPTINIAEIAPADAPTGVRAHKINRGVHVLAPHTGEADKKFAVDTFARCGYVYVYTQDDEHHFWSLSLHLLSEQMGASPSSRESDDAVGYFLVERAHQQKNGDACNGVCNGVYVHHIQSDGELTGCDIPAKRRAALFGAFGLPTETGESNGA